MLVACLGVGVVGSAACRLVQTENSSSSSSSSQDVSSSFSSSSSSESVADSSTGDSTVDSSSDSSALPPILVDPGTQEEKLPYEIVKDEYFVKSGKTDYVIVYPKDGGSEITSAVSEMENFFEEAIGADVETYADSDSIPMGKKLISIGNTTQAQSALGAGADGAKMEKESFRLTTKEDDLYIVGQGYGVVWGVYQLLNYMFDYEFYKADVYTLNTNVSNLNFFTIDETQVPDITYLPCNYNGLRGSGADNILRYRLRNEWEVMGGGSYHNSFKVLDPNKYSLNHSAWYSTGNAQLCYTAHGNAEELSAMVDAAVDYYMEELKIAPKKTYVAFIMQDSNTWCTCDACLASEEKYGAKSTAMLQMSQLIHEGISEELAAINDSRDVKVVPMVYYQSENLPAVFNEETGKYELVDDSLNFDGVVPFWAAMTLKKHEKPWSDPENASAVEMLKQLNDLFEEFWVWDYAVNFHDYLTPFNTFTSMSEDFQFLGDFNIGFYLYQCDHDAGNTTGFGALKLYLSSKLRWNADLDVNELTDNFFRNVYGPGGSAMQEIYQQYCTLATLNAAGYGEVTPWDQSIYSPTVQNAQYWPKGLLKEWLSLIEESYASIEDLKTTDKEAYEIYAYNIRMESIFARYLYARNYMKADTNENISFKLEVYYDVIDNFSRVRESQDAASNLASWLGISSYI